MPDDSYAAQMLEYYTRRIDPLHDHELPPGDSFASFDLDVIDAAFAPGVSAINPCGWLPPQAEHWIFRRWYPAGGCTRPPHPGQIVDTLITPLAALLTDAHSCYRSAE